MHMQARWPRLLGNLGLKEALPNSLPLLAVSTNHPVPAPGFISFASFAAFCSTVPAASEPLSQTIP
jgi:hypothetical protein